MSNLKYAHKVVNLTKDDCCDIIDSPVVTEKSSVIAAHNQFAFKVTEKATKPLVKKAVEMLFNVKVKSVNILRLKGKVKRFRGHIGRRSDQKRAIVTLADGQSIDLTAKIS